MEESLQSIPQKLKTEAEVASLTVGCSMQPMLRQHKDIVVIERINRPIKKYDVVLYQKDKIEKLVLHRVLRVKKDHYVIRGDNTYALEYIPKGDIIGVLKEFYRDGKYYNCETSKGYQVYVVFMRLFYPFRYFWKRLLRPILAKIKHLILK